MAFQTLVTRCPDGRVKASRQPSTAEAPVFLTVTSAVKPPCHTWVSYATWQAGAGSPGPPGPVPPVTTEEEKEVTASPAPFCHGSNPA